MRRMIAMLGAVPLLAGCQPQEPDVGEPVAGGSMAVAPLRTSAGADAGRSTATEVAGGVRFTVDARGLPPGAHAAHVHTTGRCDPPTFESAGPHWNPTNAEHGVNNPQGPHMGDLPNMEVGTDGRGTLAIVMPGATMAGLLDADGAALIVHANADDLVTDPSGNAGGRIACGVFQMN